MYRLVLSKLDVERKRPLDVSRTVLRHIARGEGVDAQQINQKAPLLFGYPNAHSMHAEAGKTPLPEPRSLTRNDIHLGLTKNLRELAKVPFMAAFRAVGKAKLRILDIDARTVEACQEASLAELQLQSGKRIMIDEFHRAGESLKPNPLAGKLIAAGAPGYQLLVRRDGSAFDWSFLLSVYEAIHRSAGKVLEGDPMVADCASMDEAVDRYLREVLVPEAWVSIEDMIRDGLEVPGHDVLALYTAEGTYIGRVIRNVALQAVVPKLYYTDEELVKGKASLFRGSVEQRLGAINVPGGIFNSSFNVPCTEPVFVSLAPYPGGLRINDLATVHSVEPDTLEELSGLRCGSSRMMSGIGTTILWAIDGEQVFLGRDDRQMFNQGYVMAAQWLSERDFPLLFPVVSYDAAGDSSNRGAWLDRYKPKMLLPPQTVEFQERLSRKFRRDIAEAREILSAPTELEALLRLLLERTTSEDIEKSAQLLVKAEYEVPASTDTLDVEDERQRLNDLWRLDQEKLPALVASLQARHPFLTQFGLLTNWAVVRASAGDLEHFTVADLGVDDVLIELVLLASASASGMRPERFGKAPAALAVGRWVAGDIDLKEVQDVATVFAAYEKKANLQEMNIRSAQRAVTKELDCRERSRELGVAYAGERVTVRPSERVTAS